MLPKWSLRWNIYIIIILFTESIFINFKFFSLKPENILIDQEGYIRLTDFGLSKRNVQGEKDAFSVCGTPEYLAPEILKKLGHGKTADWWTLGCILFEMTVGYPPFSGNNRQELFERIKS